MASITTLLTLTRAGREGQFRPLPGSQPHIGSTNQLETVAEYQVEFVVADELIENVIAAMKSVHPYEQPAYQAWQTADL